MEFKRPVQDSINASVAPKSYDYLASGVDSLLAIDTTYATRSLLAQQEAEQERQINEGAEATLQFAEGRGLSTSPNGVVALPDHPAPARGPVGATFPENVEPSGEYQLTDEDKRYISETSRVMRSNATGLYQGATSFEQSYANQDLILKRAISKRPWLKAELIDASRGYLGVDVYQRGYSALADAERARMRSMEAAQEGAVRESIAKGEAIKESGMYIAMLSKLPEGPARTKWLTATPAELGALSAQYESTPLWEIASAEAQAAKLTKNYAENAKTANELEGTTGTRTARTIVSGTAASVVDGFRRLSTAPNMFDEAGMPTDMGRTTALSAISAAKSQIASAKAQVLAATGEDGSAEFAGLEMMVKDFEDNITGTKSANFTKAMVEANQAYIDYAVQQSPDIQNMMSILLKANPALASMPQVAAQQAAAQLGAMAVANPVLSQSVIEGIANRGLVLNTMATEVQNTKGSSPQAASSAVQALSQTNLSHLQVIAATATKPEILGSQNGTRANAVRILSDSANALNMTGLTPATTIMDNMSGPMRHQTSVAFAKAVYTVQQGLIQAAKLDTKLARLSMEYQPGSGTSRLNYKADGRVEILGWDSLPNPTPAEQAYKAEVDQWNTMLTQRKAAPVMAVASGGKTLTLSYRSGILAAPLSNPTNSPPVAPFPVLIYTPMGEPPAKKPQPPMGGSSSGSEFQLRDYASAVQKVESRHNPDAVVGKQASPKPLTQMTLGEVKEFQAGLKGNTAVGLYQFIDSTLKSVAEKAGVGDDEMFSVATQNKLFKAWTEQIRATGRKAIGRELDAVDTYLMHFAGETAGRKLLAAPDSVALSDVLTAEALASNPTYAKAKTVGGLRKLLEKKLAP